MKPVLALLFILTFLIAFFPAIALNSPSEHANLERRLGVINFQSVSCVSIMPLDPGSGGGGKGETLN